MHPITENFSIRKYEYDEFMKSFNRHYPELYAKYAMMIVQPLGRSAVVTVSHAHQLKGSVKKILGYIINEYYSPVNN